MSRPDPPPLTGRRVGLVLGAGGLVGLAYHAGTLFSLEHHLGWDPREADVVVGTSAGSIAGMLLRSGLGAEDLVAAVTGLAPTDAGRWAVERLPDPRRQRVDGGLASVVTAWRPPPPRALLRAAASRSPGGLAAAVLGGGGTQDAFRAVSRVALLTGGDWPDGDLRICASRDGRRIVFDRHGPALVEEAVAASCAVPGIFSSVPIDGTAYVDGGVVSTTNADVVAGDDLDVVIVIAPMSGVSWWRADAVARALWRRRLRLEIELVGRGGAEVVVFEPSTDTLRTMGLDLLAGDRADRVVREAFLAAGDQVRDEPALRR